MAALMVQGCTSWAGKSLLTTALCRWFARQGVHVAPFKAQNMSNNARVVDGGEIGVAQWLQARAAGVTPDVRMNPVLIKPEHNGGQVIVRGQLDERLSHTPWRNRSEALWPTIVDSLRSLQEEFDLVVMEGAGSPAEINLAANDVVNMRVAEFADAPVLLAVDIDRGGAFAHLYGTWALLPEAQRERIAGFVLNRFRGDPSLLPPGPEDLERLTGVPTIGVVPMLQHDLPDEDGAALHAPRRGGLPSVAIIRYPSASNLDEFTQLEQVADVRWVTEPWHLGADPHELSIVVLPGSKHVSHDLKWLRDSGLDTAVCEHAAAGVRILGICGGLQMLGTQLDDPDGVEGPPTKNEGLGLLPVVTVFAEDKALTHREVTLPYHVDGPWRPLAGLTVNAYEIHHGRTTNHDHCGLTAGSGGQSAVITDGTVAGWYLHGVLEDPEVLAALFGARPTRTLEATFDLLADAVDEHLDTALLKALVA